MWRSSDMIFHVFCLFTGINQLIVDKFSISFAKHLLQVIKIRKYPGGHLNSRWRGCAPAKIFRHPTREFLCKSTPNRGIFHRKWYPMRDFFLISRLTRRQAKFMSKNETHPKQNLTTSSTSASAFNLLWWACSSVVWVFVRSFSSLLIFTCFTG